MTSLEFFTVALVVGVVILSALWLCFGIYLKLTFVKVTGVGDSLDSYRIKDIIPKYRILRNGAGEYMVQYYHNHSNSNAIGVGLWLKAGEGFTTMEGAEKHIEYHKDKTRKAKFNLVKEVY